MKKIKKINSIIFLIVYFFIGLSIFSPVLAMSPINEIEFVPQVGIPNSEFVAETGVEIGQTNSSIMTSDLLARYIKAFYNWGLSIVGVVAVLILMAGGLIWLTSAGDSGKIEEAKKMISGGLLGSFLLIGAYFLLTLINPKLNKLPSIEMDNIANRGVTDVKSCETRFEQKTCEELLFCEWKNAKCIGKKGKCSKDKAIFGTESVLCCCQLDQSGKYTNCNWATYMGGLGVGPNSGPCTACGTNFTNVSNSAEGNNLCAAATAIATGVKPDYSTSAYCRGYWCNQDERMSKYFYCNPTAKKNGESCPHDGYCYDKVCWTSDVQGNNEGKIGEPCGDEGGKCYTSCPKNYERDYIGGRNCEGSTDCCMIKK